MRHHSIVLSLSLGLVLAISFGAVSSARQPSSPARVITDQNEVRALWVVRTTLTSPERIHKMVESAKASGFNTLIVQVRGRGDAYYRSTREPRALELKDQPLDFDPLAVTLGEARLQGLKVHAWINTS